MNRHVLNAMVAALLVGAPAAVHAAPSPAAEAVAAQLASNWQDIEVVVFERLGVTGTPGEDDRPPRSGPRVLPTSFWSVVDADDLGPGFGLDESTRPAVETFQLGTAAGLPGFQRPAPDSDPGQSPEAATAMPAQPEGPEPVPAAVAPPPPTPDELFRDAVSAFEASLLANALRAQSPSTHRLRSAASRLAAQGRARILWHRRWTQPFRSGIPALPVYVQAGYPVLDLKQLEGLVHISGRSSFRVNARFWLHGPFPGQQPVALPVRADGGLPPQPAVTTALGAWHEITESRDLKPGEVHYLDHPWFGVLVSIDAVNLPDALLAAYAATQAAPAAASETGVQN